MKLLFVIWKALNVILAVFFLYLVIEAWVEIFYYRNAQKQYYYLATLFVIPLVVSLAAVFGWNLDDGRGERYR